MVFSTFIGTIVTGDPGHPLSRVQKNQNIFLAGKMLHANLLDTDWQAKREIGKAHF
jgi:hypothetical protein